MCRVFRPGLPGRLVSTGCESPGGAGLGSPGGQAPSHGDQQESEACQNGCCPVPTFTCRPSAHPHPGTVDMELSGSLGEVLGAAAF